MDYSTGRALLQAAGDSSQDTAPFFGFIGAAAALVFSCERGWAGPRVLGVLQRPPRGRQRREGVAAARFCARSPIGFAAAV
jgi:hypothetical protein